MRAIIMTLALAGAVAACSGAGTTAVSESPPTVSYRVDNNDMSQANANAAAYCGRYNMQPQLQAVQPDGTENLAHYACVGSAAGSPAYPYETVTPAPTTTQCADWMHQSRPGGSDYHGPPVPGCPQR
jgi:Flp pilus assembly protein TadD